MTPVNGLDNVFPMSSPSMTPNTEGLVHSSSTAPIEEEPKANATVAKSQPQKKKKKATSKTSQSAPAQSPTSTQDDSSKNGLPPYTPPPYERSSVPTPPIPFGLETIQRPVETEPPTEEHRTVLQALMGWDDVPFGRRWNHFVQHGFTGMHGNAFNELMQLVNAENQGASAGGRSATYGQELREKARHRTDIRNEWDKLLAEWNSGRYASGDMSTVQAFFAEAQRLRQEYANEGFNPAELRNPSINAGGFQQGFQKDLQADRAKLDWIGGWLSEIQQHVARDPNWLNGGPGSAAQMYFDKLSEYTILNWAQSKGAIADAEKIRAQVESMPWADRQVYNKFMSMFFNTNTVAQLEALANSGTREAMSALDDMYKFMNLAERGNGAYGTVDKNGDLVFSKPAEHYLNSFMHGVRILRSPDNNPIDINTAVTSYKNAKDAFQQYVMQNANVDRAMVWNSAVDQYNIYKDEYNRKLPQLGLLWGWGHTGPRIDENFGDYLKKWQETQTPDEVMSNARLSFAHPPKLVRDPFGKRGGAGGEATEKTNSIPDNAKYNKARNRWEWKEKGRWRYQNG